MARLRYNGLRTTLGGSLTNSATSVTFAAALTHSNGTAVPTITGSDYIPLTILDASGHLSEIVYLTAYTSGATTGTISRGQEGTSGVAHSSGDVIGCGPTVADAGGTTDTWHNVSAFSNSWVNYGGTEQVASYMIDGAGNVQLRGTIKSGTVGVTAFTLPVGYRPTSVQHRPIVCNNGTADIFGQLVVTTNGDVGVYLPGANNYARLEASFPTA